MKDGEKGHVFKKVDLGFKYHRVILSVNVKEKVKQMAFVPLNVGGLGWERRKKINGLNTYAVCIQRRR